MNRDYNLELLYEEMLEESFKSKLAGAGLALGLTMGGLDYTYSSKLPEPTKDISAEVVVKKALKTEKNFITNELTDESIVESLKGFLKSYNKVKRNLSEIEEYAKKYNVRINNRALEESKIKLEKLHELSREIDWRKLKSIFNRVKNLLGEESLDSKLSQSLTNLANKDLETTFMLNLGRLLMTMSDITN